MDLWRKDLNSLFFTGGLSDRRECGVPLITSLKGSGILFSANVEDDPSLRNRTEVFRDRTHAGELLADKLIKYAADYGAMIVIAIPSGGVPVGYAVAERLNVALEIILVRKITIPWEPEAGYGSVTLDGSTLLNDALVGNLGLSKSEIKEGIRKAKEGLEERAKKFFTERKQELLQDTEDKTTILVDDGLASGYTMLASVQSVRKRKPRKIIVAVPTGSINAIKLVSPHVERLFCLNVRSGYSFAVADAYEEWRDISEEEAADLFAKGKRG
jgi:predicted phosphoribosyltransferase